MLAIHQMLDQELDTWNIHKSPVDWEFVHKNYDQVIVGGAGLLHSVFEKFWVDLDKNCKLPIIIWGIGVCLPDNDSVKGVPKSVVQSVFNRAIFANVRDELTRDFYDLKSDISITACPTLVYVANKFKVAPKSGVGNKILHSSHVDLEPRSTTPQIKQIIEDSPSLKPYLSESLSSCYQNARKLFLDLSGMAENLVSLAPICTIEQALNEDWFPEISK